MNKEEIKKFEQKLIRVYVIDNSFWTGNILTYNSEVLTLKDKFGRLVSIDNKTIKRISEWVIQL